MSGSFGVAELKLARRAEKEWSFDNPILIRKQNYLARLMCDIVLKDESSHKEGDSFPERNTSFKVDQTTPAISCRACSVYFDVF